MARAIYQRPMAAVRANADSSAAGTLSGERRAFARASRRRGAAQRQRPADLGGCFCARRAANRPGILAGSRPPRAHTGDRGAAPARAPRAACRRRMAGRSDTERIWRTAGAKDRLRRQRLARGRRSDWAGTLQWAAAGRRGGDTTARDGRARVGTPEQAALMIDPGLPLAPLRHSSPATGRGAEMAGLGSLHLLAELRALQKVWPSMVHPLVAHVTSRYYTPP